MGTKVSGPTLCHQQRINKAKWTPPQNSSLPTSVGCGSLAILRQSDRINCMDPVPRGISNKSPAEQIRIHYCNQPASNQIWLPVGQSNMKPAKEWLLTIDTTGEPPIPPITVVQKISIYGDDSLPLLQSPLGAKGSRWRPIVLSISIWQSGVVTYYRCW